MTSTRQGLGKEQDKLQNPKRTDQVSKTHIMSYSVKSKKSGKTYILHSRVTVLKGGREQRIFFFAGEAKEGAIDALPDGYMVSENERTGLPILKKKVS